MSFSEHITAAIQAHEEVAEANARLQAAVAASASVLETQRQTIAELEAKLRECEAQPPATPPAPEPEPEPLPPPPPPAPTTRPPAILNERFTNGVDWRRFFAEEGDDAPDRAKFVQQPSGLSVLWTAGSPSGSKRSELGIRAVPGGGETPRRDPIGSERWYGLEFLIPEAYNLGGPMADEKRVLWQCHQANLDGFKESERIVNPPLSLELRNGTFRLVRSVLGQNREEFLDPDDDPDGIPCVKNVWNRLVLHVHWHPTAGFIEGWFNAKHIAKVTRKTCNAPGDGMNCKTGSYQPGYVSFPAGYSIMHLIRWFAIGNETNKLEDFLVT